jgi:hypothetical protein
MYIILKETCTTKASWLLLLKETSGIPLENSVGKFVSSHLQKHRFIQLVMPFQLKHCTHKA